MGPELLLETYKAAVENKNVEIYASIFDKDVKVFDMWQQWTHDGINSWTQMAKEWFASLGTEKDVVTFDDIQIKKSESMALITAIARFTAVNEKGQPLRYLQNRFTWVARKKRNTWKVIHQHTSSPIDFETMKPILQIS